MAGRAIYGPTRWALYYRFRWQCVYCRKRFRPGKPLKKKRGRCKGRKGFGLSIDHFNPICREGKTDPWNLLVACLDCNNLKNGQEPFAWCVSQGIDIEYVLTLLTPLTKEERRIGHKLYKMYCPDGRLERQAKKAKAWRKRIKAELAKIPF